MKPFVKSLDVVSDEYSGPYMLNPYGGDAIITLKITGTCDLTVEATNSDLQDPDVTGDWWDLTADLTNATATVASGIYAVPRFIRVKRTSYSSTPTVTLHYSQATAG